MTGGVVENRDFGVDSKVEGRMISPASTRTWVAEAAGPGQGGVMKSFSVKEE